MRKQKKGRKLSRKRSQRKALLKSQACSLFLKEKIKTTEAKAKELARFAEKQVTRAKIGDAASQKLLLTLFPQAVVRKLVKEIAPRYRDRRGGCTRIIKLGNRPSDGAKIAIIELVK